MYRVFDDVFVWYKVEVCLEIQVEVIKIVKLSILEFLPSLALLPAEKDWRLQCCKIAKKSPVQITVMLAVLSSYITQLFTACSHQNCPRPLFTLTNSVLINSKGLSSSDFYWKRIHCTSGLINNETEKFNLKFKKTL